MTAQRIAKWKRWIDGPIKNDVFSMHLQRDCWLKVGKMLSQNAERLPESYWWQLMFDTYSTTQAVAVRRQADTHSDVASLGKLISEVRDDPSGLTRDRWIALWNPDDDHDRWYADTQWDENYAGAVGDYFDPALAGADFESLAAAASDVRRYVNRHVAHSQAAVGAAVTLDLNDVHDSIEVIGNLFSRYSTLFSAAGWAFLVPVIQHDWEAVFQVPWAVPDPTEA